MQRVGAVLLLTLSLLTGCQSDDQAGGDEYIGKWESVQVRQRTMEIDRNGGRLQVRLTANNFLSGAPETSEIPVTFKDGALNMRFALGPVLFTIDKTSGHLKGASQFANEEYKRT